MEIEDLQSSNQCNAQYTSLLQVALGELQFTIAAFLTVILVIAGAAYPSYPTLGGIVFVVCLICWVVAFVFCIKQVFMLRTS